MIIVTGGAGFIGSCYVARLNEDSVKDIVIVDDVGQGAKWQNLRGREFNDIIGISDFERWLKGRAGIRAIVHMGACSTTTEADMDFLVENNLHYSAKLFEFCTESRVPFIYASSAATYGAGEQGYSDDVETISKLRPINKYGYSKHLFDQWVLRQENTPSHWAGLKFFNVYGAGEHHKGGQASVVFHAFPQVRDRRTLRLFKSYRDGVEHGEQKRDFVFVKDACEVIHHFVSGEGCASGIYNVGTGKARTFKDLGKAVFDALDAGTPKFEWIDMPDDVREHYQYFTEATLDNLREHGGFRGEFVSLEDGVRDYVQNHLVLCQSSFDG